MPAHTPGELHEIINRCVNEADIKTVMELHQPDSVAPAGPGKVASGLAGIREAFLGFKALKGRLDMEPPRVIVAGTSR